LALAKNPILTLSPEQFAALAARAAREELRMGDARLARALLARGSIGLEHAPLFFAADAAQRVALVAAARRMNLGRSSAPLGLTARPGQIDSLDRLAMDADDRSFVAELADALRCDEELATRVTVEPSGDALVLALVALRARDDVIVRILVSRDLASPGPHSRVGALTRLRSIITPQTATRILVAIRGETSAAQRAPLLPQLDPTAAALAGRAGALKPASSPAVARRRKAFAFASGRRYIGEGS